MKGPSRVGAYRKLVREAAKELGAKPSDEIVVKVATYRLLRQQIEARLLDGRDVSADELLKVDEALKAVTPRKDIRVEIAFVGRVHDCPRCGFVSRTDGPSSPLPARKLPTTDDAAPAPPPTKPDNVISLPRSIHDGAPVKNGGVNPWPGVVK